MKLQDDGAGKKLHGLFLEREMEKFGPKDVQMEVATQNKTWGISGMMPRWENTTGKSRM